MSRDIFVQDIPALATSVDEIPEGWMPKPLGYLPSEVIASVKVHASGVDDSDPSWVHISDIGVDIDLNVGTEMPLMGFSFHDRSTDRDASDRLIARILADLGLRAFDPEGAESGIFSSTQP